jgi:hypothetical protein
MRLGRVFKGIIEKAQVAAQSTLEAVGVEEIMSTSISDVTTFNCPYPFGGFNCGVIPVGIHVLITASSSTQNYTIRRVGPTPLPFANDFYTQGTLKLLSGRAAGVELQVNNLSGTDPVYNLKLLSVLTDTLRPGTVALLYNGCTKTMSRCNDYDNLNRGRQIPYIRGSKNFANAEDLPDI